MNKEDRLKLFVNEFNDITEENLRKFAEELVVNADEYFFTIAASTSGKYHPQFDLGDGGLVRHTRCVVFFVECEAISRMFTEHETNLLIVSAIAHDIKKCGNNGSRYTVDDHPKIASDYIKEINAKTKLLSAEDEMLISNIVYSHMGKWGHEKGMPLPKTELEKALQAADYIASRKELLGFDFRPTENVIVEKKEVGPGDFVIGFGRNTGKTIKEVYEAEKSKGDTYLHWMMRQTEFNNQEARINAMMFLKEIGKLPNEYLSELGEKINNEQTDTVVEQVQADVEDDLPF